MNRSKDGRSQKGELDLTEPQRLLADEHDLDRVGRAHEREVGPTGGAELAGALGRLSLPVALAGGAGSSGDVQSLCRLRCEHVVQAGPVFLSSEIRSD